MNNFKLEIDFNILKEHRLGLEAYLILYCLTTNNSKLIADYVNNCKKIRTEVFNNLREEGYIDFSADQNGIISFKLLSLTDKGKSLILSNVNPITSESRFEEFRKIYPSSVKVPGRQYPRRLHNDLARCRKLYSNLMMETTHETLCMAAEMYYNEKLHTNSVQFMQDLATWLHQKNYQQYLEDIEKSTTFTTQVPKFTDDI